MKRLLLAASLVVLGGCVAPGYDYVQPDYAGTGGYYSGGGYSDGYRDGTAGYYPDYYGGCCDAAGLSIGYGYGYGYPGYYAGGSYPYGYYGSYGYYGYYSTGNGNGSQTDAPQPWRGPDHPPIPHHSGVAQSEWSAPLPRMASPTFEPHVAPPIEAPSQFHTGHAVAPVRSWTPPPRSSKPKARQF